MEKIEQFFNTQSSIILQFQSKQTSRKFFHVFFRTVQSIIYICFIGMKNWIFGMLFEKQGKILYSFLTCEESDEANNIFLTRHGAWYIPNICMFPYVFMYALISMRFHRVKVVMFISLQPFVHLE